MAIDCLTGAKLNNPRTWVCTFGSATISLAFSSEIDKLPPDPINSTHVALFSLLLLIDSSNLSSKNSKPEATKCVGSSFVNESLFVEFHA
jgi:hypothetical protein